MTIIFREHSLNGAVSGKAESMKKTPGIGGLNEVLRRPEVTAALTSTYVTTRNREAGPMAETDTLGRDARGTVRSSRIGAGLDRRMDGGREGERDQTGRGAAAVAVPIMRMRAKGRANKRAREKGKKWEGMKVGMSERACRPGSPGWLPIVSWVGSLAGE